MKKYLLLTMLLVGSSLYSSVLEVTKSNFDTKVLQSKKPVIVKVYSKTCPACLKIIPVYKEIGKEMDSVNFTKLDGAKEWWFIKKYKVQYLPTFFVFKNGKKKETIVGAMAKDKLKGKFKSALK
jgi:thioredoxin 1